MIYKYKEANLKCVCAIAIFCICAGLALSSCFFVGGGGDGGSGPGAEDSRTATGSTGPGIEAEPVAVPVAAGAELYIIGKYIDSWSEEKYSTIINKDGGLVMKGVCLDIVYNFENTAAIAITQTKYEKDGRYMTALFDVAGNMIYDFALCDYEGDKGSLVRRYELEKPEESSDPPMGPLYEGGSYYILIDMTNGRVIDGVQKRDSYDPEDESPIEQYYEYGYYEYIDGSVGIRYDEEKNTYDLIGDPENRKVLFGGADTMDPLVIDQAGKIQLFLAVKNNTMYKLSRDGSIEAEYKISDMDSAYRIGENNEYSYSREPDDDDIPPGGVYEYINVETVPSLSGGEGPFGDGRYFNNSDEVRYIVVYRSIETSDDDTAYVLDSCYDVFDTDGKMVWHDLRPTSGSSDFMLGPGRIAIRQGLTQGLMDESGKWLYKESIYNTLED